LVVGLGRAGIARIQAILSTPESCILRALVSRRPETEALASITPLLSGGPSPLFFNSLSEALSSTISDSIDCVFVCSENNAHEAAVRTALEAGKHVSVEYPLCLSSQVAEGLVALARSSNKQTGGGKKRRTVLHVEHIELMTGQHAALRTAVHEKLAAGGGDVHIVSAEAAFTGGALPQTTWGSPAFSGISRLTRLWELLGPLKPVSATAHVRERDAEGAGAASTSTAASASTTASSSMEVQLIVAATTTSSSSSTTSGGVSVASSTPSSSSAPATVRWTEVRREGAKRSTHTTIRFSDGSVLEGENTMTVTAAVAAGSRAAGAAAGAGTGVEAGGSSGGRGLFQRDLDLFIAKVVQSVDGGRGTSEAADESGDGLDQEIQWLRCAEAVDALLSASSIEKE
jgi:predicted dehydrogenase